MSADFAQLFVEHKVPTRVRISEEIRLSFYPAPTIFREITFIPTCYFNCHFKLNNHPFEVSKIHVDIDSTEIALLQYEGVRFFFFFVQQF